MYLKLLERFLFKFLKSGFSERFRKINKILWFPLTNLSLRLQSSTNQKKAKQNNVVFTIHIFLFLL